MLNRLLMSTGGSMHNNPFKLDLCNYTINKNGVLDADGEILVSIPILPVSKYLSSDGTQFIGICKLYQEQKVEVFVPLKNLEDAKNLDILAKLGVVVLKSTIEPIANFLFKLVLMNFGRLQELTCVDKFGWYEISSSHTRTKIFYLQMNFLDIRTFQKVTFTSGAKLSFVIVIT